MTAGPLSPTAVCAHGSLTLLSPWEIIRKYRCTDCSAVLTCACDVDFAAFIVPHQALTGRDQHTHDDVPVSNSLTPGTCQECRREVPPAYPRGAHRGAASLLRRYYWREIERASELEFLEWCQAEKLSLFGDDGRPLFFYLRHDHHEKYEEIESAVIERTGLAHEQSPKYDFTRPSDADVIRACDVTVEAVQACYVASTTGPALVLPLDVDDPSQAVRVEEFIARRLRADGREVMFCESRPFQAIYGTLMWLWVQAPALRGEVAYAAGLAFPDPQPGSRLVEGVGGCGQGQGEMSPSRPPLGLSSLASRASVPNRI